MADLTAVPMVETYRVLRRLDLGNGNFRDFGDLIPEASDWELSVRAVYLRAAFIERAYVPAEEYNAFMASQASTLSDPEAPAETPEVVEPPVVNPPVADPEKEGDGEKQEGDGGEDESEEKESVIDEVIPDLGTPELATVDAEPKKRVRVRRS